MGTLTRMRLAIVGAFVLGIVVAVAAAVLVGRHGPSRSAEATQPAAPTGCAERLLADWADGRIDGVYRLPCYRAAMRSLPTDLRVYSSAADDIGAALSKRIVQSASSNARRAAG